MISFITGKPGDGKSLFATRQILEDLVNTEVFIVTNIPLNLGRVAEYVANRRGRNGRPFDIDDRLKVIPDAEVYEFYRHRSGDLVLDWSPDKSAGEDGTKRIPRPEFVAAMKAQFLKITYMREFQRPVNYYIDEAHNFFSSREWATNGRGLLYYASQHRHLWDNIFLITQVMENVEKQLRSLVSETHVVRNQLRRCIGPIRMRPVFKVSGFYGVPGGNIKPFAVTTFPLDPSKVAACYKTVGALGVHSTPEQTRNKAPLPWWCLPVGGAIVVLGIAAAFVALPYLGMKAGGAVVGGALGPDKSTVEQTPVDGTKTPAAPSTRPDREKVQELPFPTGYAASGRRIVVQLSDGTTLIERDGELQRVERNSVTVAGDKLFIKPRPRPEPTPAPPSPPVVTTETPVVLPEQRSAWRRDADGVERLVSGTGTVGVSTYRN